MKKAWPWILIIIGGLVIGGCAPPVPQLVVQTVEVAQESRSLAAATQAPAAPAATAAAARPEAYPAPGSSSIAAPVSSSRPSSNRLIIKNGQLTLQVENPDAAVNQVTQAAADLGGYIISSQVLVNQKGDTEVKSATITLAVPVDAFENALNRLRSLAVIVSNETSSGQDVTDEYVDLDSRLTNLKATRDRIREFLANATTVEEALKVNEQLSQVEGEIEQVQGRMNYLFDRASYSTITVNIELYIPPTTPTPTLTPTPTPTPTPWNPLNTVKDAGSDLGAGMRGVVDFFIYLIILVIPMLLPFALLGWLLIQVWKRFFGRKTPPKAPSAS